jgi:hypothetical protein
MFLVMLLVIVPAVVFHGDEPGSADLEQGGY